MQRLRGLLKLAVLPALLVCGCNSSLLLNPSFINRTTGEIFPLVPGADNGFVLVRVTNASSQPIEFVVTAERLVASEDDPTVFNTVPETYRLLTQTAQPANDLGVLVDCPVARVGLGENLDRPTVDPGMFVGATSVGAGGFGVPSNVNPLSAEAGNFTCGDTVVFQAREAPGTAGGVVAASFVLSAGDFSGDITGLDTFANARVFLEEQAPPTETTEETP